LINVKIKKIKKRYPATGVAERYPPSLSFGKLRISCGGQWRSGKGRKGEEDNWRKGDRILLQVNVFYHSIITFLVTRYLSILRLTK
jgi:hypothetical protein